VAILTGIEDGQEIVTNGLNKLRNGIPVVVNNAVQPSNDPNPTPPNE
jgi:membrane fusion protein (multidrug efflux system)